MRIGTCCVAVLAIATLMAAQELPRHAVLPFTVGSLPDQTASQQRGVIVKEVTAREKSGPPHIEAGDVITEISGTAISGPSDISAVLHGQHAGQKVAVKLQRDGQRVQIDTTLQAAPYESLPGIDVLYRAVTVNGFLRRAVVTKPKGAGRFPAILLVSGLGCYSLDGWSKEDAPYGRLLYTLTQHGYVTMRVEKTGEGDSEGPPCSSPQADLHLETAGYSAGLQALVHYNFVQADKVFVFAHSIGPLVAVSIAQEVPIRGMIAAETIGRAWFDYELEIARQQLLDLGESYDEVERASRKNEICLHRFYVEKLTPDELLKAQPGCRSILVPGVPHTYLQQIADLDLAASWKKLDFPVLVIYGTSDPATSADESHYLVDMINSFHPGKASYVEIPGMGHILNRSASRGQFLRDHGGSNPQLHPAVLPAIQKWLSEHT